MTDEGVEKSSYRRKAFCKYLKERRKLARLLEIPTFHSSNNIAGVIFPIPFPSDPNACVEMANPTIFRQDSDSLM